MKGFKKGVALIAVLAFLITAILPAAVLAAPEERITKEVPLGSSVDFTNSGIRNMPSDEGTQYELVPDDPDAPNAGIPRSAYNITVTQTGNNTYDLKIEFPAGSLTEIGECTWELWWEGPYGYRLDCQQSVTVNVTAPQDATVVVTPAAAEQGSTANAALYLAGSTDPVTSGVTWSVSPSTGVSIDPATGAITIAADATAGDYTVTANQNGTTTTGTFKVTVPAAPEVNKDALNAAITAAQQNADGTQTSADGSDVPASQKWVTPDQKQALQDAIAAAQAVADNANATQAEVDAAQAALDAAVSTFDGQKLDGTKEPGALYSVTSEDPDNVQAAEPEYEAGAAVVLSVVPQLANENVLTGVFVTTESGEQIAVSCTDPANGEWTFTMPAANVTVSATYAPPSETEYPVTAEEGITADKAAAKVGDLVTFTFDPAQFPNGIEIKGADGKVYAVATKSPVTIAQPPTDLTAGARQDQTVDTFDWIYTPAYIIKGANAAYLAENVPNAVKYNVKVTGTGVTAPNQVTSPQLTVTGSGNVGDSAEIVLEAISVNDRVIAQTKPARVTIVEVKNGQVVDAAGNPISIVPVDPSTGGAPSHPAVNPVNAEGVNIADVVTPDTISGAMLGVTAVGGLTYSWTGDIETVGAKNDSCTSQLQPLSRYANSAVSVPDTAGQYNLSVKVTYGSNEIATVPFSVLVQGKLSAQLVADQPQAPLINGQYNVGAGAYAPKQRITASWEAGSVKAPTANHVQYLWHIDAPAGWVARLAAANPATQFETVELGEGQDSLQGATWMTSGRGAESVLLVGTALDEQLTISCEPIVPDTFENQVDARDIHEHGQVGLSVLNGESMPSVYVPADSSATPGEAGGAKCVVIGKQIDLEYIEDSEGTQNMLHGWIGEALDETREAIWFPVTPDKVDHWMMQPVGSGTIGQEIIVTPGDYDPNLLTFTTNGEIVGNVSGIHEYNLIAYGGNPGRPENEIDRIPVTLHVHLRKPLLHDASANLAPGVDSVIMTEYAAAGNVIRYVANKPGNTALATWTQDNRGNVTPQQKNLPSFEVIATMQGGDAKGWAQTQWAISDQSPWEIDPVNGIVTIADFNGMQKVSAGIVSNYGDLYAKYNVQPSEVLEAVRLNQAKGTLGNVWINSTPLYYYAKVQYGSNPECAAVLQVPFALYLVKDGDQWFVPLKANGQIAEDAFPPHVNEAPVPGATNPLTAELTAVVGSKTPTNLNTLWIPNQAPSGVTYSWTFESGPAAVTIGGATVSPSADPVKNAGTQNLSVSNFTVPGRYRFICTPAGVSAKPVLFEVNVGQISVTSYEDQADYYAAWIQPAAGKDSGYFSDSANAVFTEVATANKASDYPVPPILNADTDYDLGTLGSMLTIGKVTGLSVDGSSWVDGATVPVSLNSRFQLYFDPAGIQYGTTENGEPNYLSADPEDDNYWKNFVVLEWRYKTSQYMEDDGNSGNIPRGLGFSGVNSPMLTSGPLTAAMDGWQFALEIHDKNDENIYTTTRWVLLDLDGMNPATQPEATISSYPAANGSAVALTAGSDVTFTASAQGSIPTADLTYQWQSRPAVSQATPEPQWANITGATESTYALSNVTLAMNGTEYRCIVTNTAYAGGVKAISDSLKLNITAANGSVVIEAPSQATLINYYASRQLETSVTARTDNGDPVTYEWFVKSFVGPVPTGDAAADTIDEAAALIAASGSKKVSDMPGATVSGNAMTSAPLTEGVYEFTCRVVNANDESKSLNSPPVYVVVTQNSRKPYISVPSAPETGICSVGVTNGQSISLPCSAWIASDPGEGEDITYQWQTSSSADGPWSDLEATTPTLTINTVTPTYTGAYFRCVATNAKANESTASIPYRLNVWNVAEVPTVVSGPQSQEITWNGSVPGNEITVTSTVSVPQGSDHNTMQPTWWTPDGDYTTSSNPNLTDPALGGGTAHPVTPPSVWADDWTKPMVSLERTVANGVVTYTSTLSIPIEPGNITKARAFTGAYSVTWFNNQYINEDTGHNVEVNEKVPADTTFLVAPQATSDTANVLVLISGTPRIPVQSAASVTAGIGETASFSVTAVLNEGQNENPKGELVYVWQVSKDGGATWNNALSTDGTGQFTDTFTTIPLTQQMYDNSTASNVPGAGVAGTVGNAKTVYEYRCIVANRTTGMKAHSQEFMLTITTDAAPVQEPVLTPGEGSSITIEGTAPNRYAMGIEVTKEGTTVKDFLDEFGMDVPAGYELRIVGSDGAELSEDDIVYTGCILQLVKTADDTVVDSATIIVMGDVLGTGIVAINQVVRMAQDLNGTRPLEGIFDLAGDFNGNGTIDIADLVREAQILTLDEPLTK